MPAVLKFRSGYALYLFVVMFLIYGSYWIWHRDAYVHGPGSVGTGGENGVKDITDPNADGLTCAQRIHLANLPSAEPWIEYTPGKSQGLLDAGARIVPASDLISGKIDYETHKSRIIHQSWKTHDASGYPLHDLWHSQDHWRALHPGWIYVIWDNKDNRDLVKERYPELLDIFDGFKHEIARADFSRNLYMHAFGGVYSDLDVLPLDNLIHHLPGFTSSSTSPIAYVGEMLNAGIFGIPNAWMASSRPGHDFWKSVYTRTVQGVKDGAHPDHIEDLTGPGPLYHSVQAWKEKKGDKEEVVLLESPKIFPYSWAEPSKALHCICSAKYPDAFDPRRCISYYKMRGAWTITFWGSAWFRDM